MVFALPLVILEISSLMWTEWKALALLEPIKLYCPNMCEVGVYPGSGIMFVLDTVCSKHKYKWGWHRNLDVGTKSEGSIYFLQTWTQDWLRFFYLLILFGLPCLVASLVWVQFWFRTFLSWIVSGFETILSRCGSLIVLFRSWFWS